MTRPSTSNPGRAAAARRSAALAALAAVAALAGCATPGEAPQPPLSPPPTRAVDVPAPAAAPAVVPTAPPVEAVIAAPAPGPDTDGSHGGPLGRGPGPHGGPPGTPPAEAPPPSGLGIGGPSVPLAAGGRMILEEGLYRCELGRRVIVRRIAADGATLVLNWLNRDYPMAAVPARTGALRFEDGASGLAWITIVGQSFLLDTKKGVRVAGACNL